MKNILLIITLFISWNAIAEEKVWYCTPEADAGLHWEKGHGYKMTSFNNIERITIKQTKDNHLIISKTFGTEIYSKEECKTKFQKLIITCSDDAGATFALNPETGYAASSLALGWTLNDEKNTDSSDSMVVIAWKCESF
jgi:hypothetical protein